MWKGNASHMTFHVKVSGHATQYICFFLIPTWVSKMEFVFSHSEYLMLSIRLTILYGSVLRLFPLWLHVIFNIHIVAYWSHQRCYFFQLYALAHIRTQLKFQVTTDGEGVERLLQSWECTAVNSRRCREMLVGVWNWWETILISFYFLGLMATPYLLTVCPK